MHFQEQGHLNELIVLRGCLYWTSQPGNPNWPVLDQVPPLFLFPTKFHFAFIWEPSWPTSARSRLGLPKTSGDRAREFSI